MTQTMNWISTGGKIGSAAATFSTQSEKVSEPDAQLMARKGYGQQQAIQRAGRRLVGDCRRTMANTNPGR